LNCTVEDGFQCKNRIGRTSDCFVPTDPTIGFSATAYGPFAEGSFANVTVTRLGDNDTVVSVFYQTVDSTATRAARDNNMYAPGAAAGGDGHAASGDYVAANGTLTFAAGETVKTIDILLLADGAYDGAVDEQFVIVLSGVVDADLLDGFTTAYVAISDYDVEPSATPTPPPTQLPSPLPSAAPSQIPTAAPTPAPSQLPSAAPSQLPTSVPTPTPTSLFTVSMVPLSEKNTIMPSGMAPKTGRMTEPMMPLQAGMKSSNSLPSLMRLDAQKST